MFKILFDELCLQFLIQEIFINYNDIVGYSFYFFYLYLFIIEVDSLVLVKEHSQQSIYEFKISLNFVFTYILIV
jgi:hypothetical protein